MSLTCVVPSPPLPLLYVLCLVRANDSTSLTGQGGVLREKEVGAGLQPRPGWEPIPSKETARRARGLLTPCVSLVKLQRETTF